MFLGVLLEADCFPFSAKCLIVRYLTYHSRGEKPSSTGTFLTPIVIPVGAGFEPDGMPIAAKSNLQAQSSFNIHLIRGCGLLWGGHGTAALTIQFDDRPASELDRVQGSDHSWKVYGAVA
jgi:hypothetical protein